MPPPKTLAELREWQIAHETHCFHQQKKIEDLEKVIGDLKSRVEVNTNWRNKLDGTMVAVSLITVVVNLLLSLGWVGG